MEAFACIIKRTILVFAYASIESFWFGYRSYQCYGCCCSYDYMVDC